MSNNSNLSSPDKSVQGSGNSYLDHSTNNTDARDMSTHNSVVNNSSTSSSVDNSQHIHLNVQGADLSALGLAPKMPKEMKRMDEGNRDRLGLAVRAILQNRSNVYGDFLPKLKVMAMEFPDEDDAQYYCHLLMASGSPRNYISFYENAGERGYWLTFWAYSAYKRLGHSDDAELALSQLSKWKEQYTDNTLLMDAYGLVYECMKRNGGAYKLQEAADLVNRIVRCSEYLQPLLQLTVRIISSGRLAPTGDSTQDFYLKLYDYAPNKVTPKVVSAATPQQPPTKAAPEPVVARPAYTPPPVQQPVITRSEPVSVGSDSGEERSSVTKYLKWAIPVVLLLFVYKACFSGSDDAKEKEPTEVAADVNEVDADVSEENQATEQRASSRGSARRSERSASSGNDAVEPQQGSQPAERASSASPSASETPSSKPAAAAEAPSQSASASPSELVAEGKRAVKSFNYSKALKCFQQAASQGSSEANFQLGMLYSNGNFDGHNTDRAISYMRQAANNGNVEAMYHVGMMYTGRDNSSAKHWLQKAASNGHSKARAALERFTN